MARAQPFLSYYGFRFHALFYRDYDKKVPLPLTRRVSHDGAPLDVPIGFSIIDHTPAGLELWTAHLVDEPLLFSKLEGVKCAEVLLLARPDEDRPARVLTYSLADRQGRSDARHLGLSIKPRTVNLDAADSQVALDGVLFADARVTNVEHRVVELP